MAVIAFDGLSASGKTTLTVMVAKALDAVIVSPNSLDPLRPFTSRVNSLLKEHSVSDVSKHLTMSAKESVAFSEAFDYACGKDSEPSRLLAHLFYAGHKIVDLKVAEYVRQGKHVVLDRWQMSGWAYQSGEGYSWSDIRALNSNLRLPDVQFFVTCPPQEVPMRRMFRQKIGKGTSGQMSSGREDVILAAFNDIYASMKTQLPLYVVVNKGPPVESLSEQISRCYPAFEFVCSMLRNNGVVVKDFGLDFWLEPDNLASLYASQSNKK